jgi:hypothetical protein
MQCGVMCCAQGRAMPTAVAVWCVYVHVHGVPRDALCRGLLQCSVVCLCVCVACPGTRDAEGCGSVVCLCVCVVCPGTRDAEGCCSVVCLCVYAWRAQGRTMAKAVAAWCLYVCMRGVPRDALCRGLLQCGVLMCVCVACPGMRDAEGCCSVVCVCVCVRGVPRDA